MKTAFCFDMDGTLTKSEILPILAREIGIEPEISILTQATINGLLPFEQSFRLRIRLLSEISIQQVQDIVEKVPLHKEIANFINDNKEDCYVVTGNLDVWIKKLMDNINCKYYCAQADYEGDKLKGLKSSLNKADAVKDLKDKGYERIVAVGDGMNDVPMFEKADVKIAFGGVHPPVSSLVKLADYITYHEKSLCHILKTL